MPFLNKTVLMGNLGKDPELRYLPNGTATTRISVAYTEKWIDKTTREPKERTEWFSVQLYGGQAETVTRYMKAGDCIMVWGRFQSRSYQDKHGVERTVYDLIADEMCIIHTKNHRDTVATDDEVSVSGGLHDYLP